MTEIPNHRTAGRLWPWVLLALAMHAGLCALSVVWLSDWGEHGPGLARGHSAAQLSAVGAALACGRVAWLVRDRALHPLLRLLARWAACPPAARAAVALAAMAIAVLLVGALHWGYPGQARQALGALPPWCLWARRRRAILLVPDWAGALARFLPDSAA